MLKIESNHSQDTCLLMYWLIHYVPAAAGKHTCAEVSIRQRLQDGVHGSHVEDEAQLGYTHSDEAQQEDGTEDTLHEGLTWRGNETGH